MPSAEYEALDRVITADKRYRKFLYALTLSSFLLVMWGGYNVQQNIERKIDGLVNGSIKRGEARAQDQKTIAREEIRYTTCIFVVPIDLRTTDTQQKCFEAADLPGGLTRADFSPVVIPLPIASAATGEARARSSVTSSSSPQPTTSVTVAQPNNSQTISQPTNSTPNPTVTNIPPPTTRNVFQRFWDFLGL